LQNKTQSLSTDTHNFNSITPTRDTEGKKERERKIERREEEEEEEGG